MKSRLADESEMRLIAAVRSMTHEQRLAAYVEHCQQVARLHAAGVVARTAARAEPASKPT